MSVFPMDQFEAWDPLESDGGADPGMIIAAQKREISNILKSYTGYYDLFSELVQNALDAIEKRLDDDPSGEDGRVTVEIDLATQSITVSDNGCGMELQQLKQFLRPNFSFKSGKVTRGSKGVGATYLGYGFNSLLVSTRAGGKGFSGEILRGRDWVEDTTGTVPRPKIVSLGQMPSELDATSSGTSIRIKLTGTNIRPRNLSWNGATTAQQWLGLLRIMTPVGGIYLCEQSPPRISISVRVTDQLGQTTAAELERPSYLLPHTVLPRSGSLSEYLDDQIARQKKGADLAKIPPRFAKLNGLWGQWGGDELMGEVEGSNCPIRPRFDAEERDLAKAAGLKLYCYLAFSTDLWDGLNDNHLKLRKGARLLHGGLQLATRNMPQGVPLTIPMTNNIGFQNLAHVIVHFDNAEPDLGRKGFQPEYVKLAEKIAVSAVTAFRRRYNLLRKPGVAKIFGDELKIEQWIRQQEEHEVANGLLITGAGLFLPTEELPIRSEPLVEQDVVALFNQMLSSGLVRGIQLIASSQYNQYDGLYRVRMEPPFEKFIASKDNPLGIDGERFEDAEAFITKTKVLEYKYNLDGLIEELQTDVKSAADIGLVVAWEIGSKWREMFDVTCLLDPDNEHHRQIHGTTHSFAHSVSGTHAFEAIILHDLVRFLQSPDAEIARQRTEVAEEIG